VNAAGKDADNLFLLFRNLPGFVRPFIDPEDIATSRHLQLPGAVILPLPKRGFLSAGSLLLQVPAQVLTACGMLSLPSAVFMNCSRERPSATAL
jgi:hypothetical protein